MDLFDQIHGTPTGIARGQSEPENKEVGVTHIHSQKKGPELFRQ